MFDNQFYYQLTRKYITLFGALFSNITLVRFNEAHTAEISRIKVPIDWGDRERYTHRLVDPDYNRPVSTILPRMAFTLLNRQYDPSRRLDPLRRTPKANDEYTVDAGYTGAPYTLEFELSILSRNLDDANQILEQILPIFSPDYTITALPLPGLGLIKDIPVILNSIQDDITYDDDYEAIKWVQYTLNFTMKVHYFGAIENVKIIRTVFANTFIDPILQSGATVRVNLGPGNNGTFKLSDTVYQGNTITTSSAAGIVVNWLPNSEQLFIGGAQGIFQPNVTIRAVSTNAAYTLASFDSTPQKIVSIEITPNPPTANIGDDYGYTVKQTEYGQPIA